MVKPILHVLKKQLHQAMAKLNQCADLEVQIPNDPQVVELFQCLLSFDRECTGINLMENWKDLIEYWLRYGIGTWSNDQLSTIVQRLLEEASDFLDVFNTCFTALGLVRVLDDDVFEYHLRNLVYLGLLGKTIQSYKIWTNEAFSFCCGTESPWGYTPLVVDGEGNVVSSSRAFLPEELILKRPFPGYLGKFFVHRVVNQYIKTLARDFPKRRSLVRIYSIFQGMKKGFPAIRCDAIDRSLLEHRKNLSTEQLTDPQILEFFECTLEKQYGVLPGLLLEKCGPDANRVSVPMSVKSTVESNLSYGGQVGFGHSLLTLSPSDRGFGLCDSTFVGFGWIGRKYQVFPIYTNLPTDAELKQTLREFRWDRCDLDGSDLNNYVVQPQVILEPMKGRIITKPAVGTYMDMNLIQKSLWSLLRDCFPQFSLIGRPVCEEDIYYLADEWKDGFGWVSGDYSQATDRLHSDVTSLISKFLFSRLNLDIQLRIQRTLCSSLLDYSRRPCKNGFLQEFFGYWACMQDDPVPQKNGQLMGHVLSFLILCIANDLAFQYSFRHRRECPKRLINGDDILFLSSKGEYDRWCEDIKGVGFVTSMGKNLFSKNICQINSVLFKIHYSLAPERSSWDLGGDFYLDPECHFHYLESDYSDTKGWSEFDYSRDMDFDDLTPCYSMGPTVVRSWGSQVEFVRSVEVIPFLNMGIVLRRGKGKEGEVSRQNPLLAGVCKNTDVVGVYRSLLRMLYNPYWDVKFVLKKFRSTYSEFRGWFRRILNYDVESHEIPDQLLERLCPMDLSPEIVLLSRKFSYCIFNTQSLTRDSPTRRSLNSFIRNNPFGLLDLFLEEDEKMGWC